jgi:hypothetical protein
MGMGVFRAAIGVVGGCGVKQVKVDAVHGFRPDCRIALWECQKTCDNPTQENPWDER